MGWRVIFAARSRIDLEKIVQYIARDDPEAARRFGARLIDTAEALGNAPEIGPMLPRRPGTRFFPVGSFLIIYRPDSSKCVVRVLRAATGQHGDEMLGLALNARTASFATNGPLRLRA